MSNLRNRWIFFHRVSVGGRDNNVVGAVVVKVCFAGKVEANGISMGDDVIVLVVVVMVKDEVKTEVSGGKVTAGIASAFITVVAHSFENLARNLLQRQGLIVLLTMTFVLVSTVDRLASGM